MLLKSIRRKMTSSRKHQLKVRASTFCCICFLYASRVRSHGFILAELDAVHRQRFAGWGGAGAHSREAEVHVWDLSSSVHAEEHAGPAGGPWHTVPVSTCTSLVLKCCVVKCCSGPVQGDPPQDWQDWRGAIWPDDESLKIWQGGRAQCYSAVCDITAWSYSLDHLLFWCFMQFSCTSPQLWFS